MKRCPTCQQIKDEAEFGKNRTRKDGLQVQCRRCIKTIQHNWYVRNKSRHAANIKQGRDARANAIQANIIQYFKTHPCVDCGENNPIVLDFDHVRGSKSFNIGSRIAQGYA